MGSSFYPLISLLRQLASGIVVEFGVAHILNTKFFKHFS